MLCLDLSGAWWPVSMLIVIPSLVSGCAVPSAESAITSGRVPIRDGYAAVESSDQTLAGSVQVDWLRSFHDPALAEVVREAVLKNWSLQGAQERMEQSRLLAARAGATLSPFVDGVASAGRSDPGRDSDNQTLLRLGVAAVWELDVWGRVRAGQRGAQADASASQADLRSLREAVAAQAAQSWVLCVVARQQILVDEELLAVRTRTLRVAEARADAGVTQRMDVSIAKADLNDAEAVLRSSRQAFDDAKRALEVILGRYPDATIESPHELPAMSAQIPVGLPSDLLERRPDVLAADQRVAAAFYRTTEARAAQLPRLALTAEFGMPSEELRDVLNPENAAWNLAGNMIAPILDGGERRIDVLIAESRQREALAAYVDAAIAAFAEVETALSAETSLSDQQRELERGIAELTKARDAAELRYRRGLLSIFDLTQVEARLFAARRDLVSVRGARIVQRIELRRSLGGSFDPVEIMHTDDGGPP